MPEYQQTQEGSTRTNTYAQTTYHTSGLDKTQRDSRAQMKAILHLQPTCEANKTYCCTGNNCNDPKSLEYIRECAAMELIGTNLMN